APGPHPSPGLSGVRHPLHTTTSTGRHDGLRGGRLRRLLPVPTPRPRRLDPMTSVDMSGWSCPAPLRDYPRIVLGHGGGGVLSAELVEHLFLPAFAPRSNAGAALADAAVLEVAGARLAFTTDSYVVRPLFFPGGSIGELAVHG